MARTKGVAVTQDETRRLVAEALHEVVQDHGWIAATRTARLKAALSDLLGAVAADARAEIDVLVVASQEGVAQRLRDVGREGASDVADELVTDLEDWGYDTGLASWAVSTWSAVLPDRTLVPPARSVPATEPPPAPPTDPPPDAAVAPGVTALPEPAPEQAAAQEPEPEPEPEPGPEPVAEAERVTDLPPDSGPPTDLPPRSATSLPPLAPERTDLPPAAWSGPPSTPPPTNLPPAASPAAAGPGVTALPPRSTGPHPTPEVEQGKVSRGRRGLLVGGVLAAVVVAGGGIAALALSGGGDEPQPKPVEKADYTFQGRPVSNADQVLASAEASLRTGLVSRSGRTVGTGRCYFQVPRASSSKPAPVAGTVLCGPLLTLDGVTPALPYLALPLTEATDNGSSGAVDLAAAEVGAGTPTATVAADRELVRPDGAKPAVDPRPAPARALVRATGVVPRKTDATVAMGSNTAGVRLLAASQVYRFGSGPAARVAAPGQKLVAFRLGGWRCESKCVPFSKGGLSVRAGAATLQVRSIGETMVASVPASAPSVDLVMNRDKVTQKISLLNQKPAKGNIQVLARRPKQQGPLKPVRVTEALDLVNSSLPLLDANDKEYTSAPTDIRLKSAALEYFVAGRPRPRPGQAYVVVDLSFTRPYPYFRTSQEQYLPPSALRLRTGRSTKPLRATGIPGTNKAVFLVPGDLTGATLQVVSYTATVPGSSYIYSAALKPVSLSLRFPG